jgi:catechol 2,3-dioxygenase-like lactoylglutathione lyase family enzyme
MSSCASGRKAMSIRRVMPNIASDRLDASRHFYVGLLGFEVADCRRRPCRGAAGGLEIVHPLTDEPWGVRRFFVKDPNGVVLNVVSHRGDAPTS